VNHHAQGIPHYRQVRKDACRPEQRVPVARDYLHVAKAPYGGLEFPVETGKSRWPTFEQGSSAADPAGVTLIDLTKGPITPRTCPTHNVFSRPRTRICQGERRWSGMNGAGGGRASKKNAKAKTPGATSAPGAPGNWIHLGSSFLGWGKVCPVWIVSRGQPPHLLPFCQILRLSDRLSEKPQPVNFESPTEAHREPCKG
jgi:hypothetical protein